MNNQELIVTIISTLFTLISVVLGFLASKSEKAKKFYKRYIEIEKLIQELCIIAETNYTEGKQKKKYVLSAIGEYLKQNNIDFDIEIIDNMIESFISATKKIN